MARPRTRMNIQNMTRIALCVAVLCLASYLVVPLPFTPVVLSLHTVVVNLVGLILPPRQAVCAMAVYLLMGAVGLPVFAGGAAGPGKLFGPTGGFYFGFLLAVPVISLCRGEPGRFLRYFGVTALLGVPIQHVCAIVMMCLTTAFSRRRVRRRIAAVSPRRYLPNAPSPRRWASRSTARCGCPAPLAAPEGFRP